MFTTRVDVDSFFDGAYTTRTIPRDVMNRLVKIVDECFTADDGVIDILETYDNPIVDVSFVNDWVTVEVDASIGSEDGKKLTYLFIESVGQALWIFLRNYLYDRSE